jgi:hypothetical protein
MPSITVIIRWVGIVDGVLVAAATALAQAYPAAAPTVQTIIEVAGTITSLLAAIAHVSGGSASGGGPVAVSK